MAVTHGGSLHGRVPPAAFHDENGELVVFGVDPGLGVTGYGAVACSPARTALVGYGHIRTDTAAPIEQRLWQLHADLAEALQRFGAREVAVETPFFGVNARSAIMLAQARAMALLVAAEAGLRVYEYAPADVKRSVAGYGRGDKEQVARGVVLMLGLAAPPTPADASDALAIALCHYANRRTRLLLGELR